MNAPPEPEQDSPLAAIISDYAAGNLDRDQVELALHRAALDRGATWAQIGQLTGISGKEAKRRSHKLAERIRRDKAAAAEGTDLA